MGLCCAPRPIAAFQQELGTQPTEMTDTVIGLPGSSDVSLDSVVCVTGGPVCGSWQVILMSKARAVYEKRIGNKWAVSGLGGRGLRGRKQASKAKKESWESHTRFST